MPTLGGDALYLQQELASVSQSIKTLNRALEDSRTLVASLQSDLDATNTALAVAQGGVTTLNGKVAAINNPQVLQFAPTSPSTSSWTAAQGYMQGWGSVAKMTPTRSGKVLVMGVAWRAPTAQPGYIYGNIYFGTGTAPAALSTAAAGGTTDTSITVGSGSTAASVYDLVNFKTVVTGLTIGTQYWFDARMISGVTTSITCANDHIILVEL
jgi:hypothetical protein